MDYKDAGVDLEKDSKVINHIKSRFQDIGSFSGMFDLSFLSDFYEYPMMSVSVDGVGTKIMLFKDYGLDFSIIGHDLFAMCANDVICSGAIPYIFADYIAYSDLDVKFITAILNGLMNCCDRYGVTLIGGETAQMPGMYPNDTFDVAGTCIGFCEKEDMTVNCAQPGDYLIGIASNGIHANGYSLVRKVLSNFVTGQLPLPIFDFIKPTTMYVNVPRIIRDLMDGVYGMAHITGGGIESNVKRVTGGYNIQLYYNWDIPKVFHAVQMCGGISREEMYKVFNMGIGFVLIVDQRFIVDIVDRLNAGGYKSKVIGEVVETK